MVGHVGLNAPRALLPPPAAIYYQPLDP